MMYNRLNSPGAGVRIEILVEAFVSVSGAFQVLFSSSQSMRIFRSNLEKLSCKGLHTELI